jgi:hypothetical protein
MSLETKIKEIIAVDAVELASQVGLVAMVGAATISSMPDHLDKKLVLSPQAAVIKPANATAEENTLRRERDDTAPHMISYSTFQRTPGRTGKL